MQKSESCVRANDIPADVDKSEGIQVPTSQSLESP